MYRHLMSSDEIIKYGTKLSQIKMPVMSLSAYGGKERFFNPNLCTLINPNASEQIDMHSTFYECKIFVHQDPWQVYLDTTPDKKLDICLIQHNKYYYGVKVIVNLEKVTNTIAFLGALRFRQMGEDLIQIAFWYNGKF